MQGGGQGIKGPATSPQGQPIDVQVVAPGTTHILVTGGLPGEKPQQIPVAPGGRATIPPQPHWPAGTVLFVFTNTTPVRAILIEIVPEQGQS